MSQEQLNKLLDKMSSLMHWKSVEAAWRDDANNPYAPGWCLELRGCSLYFDLKHYIVCDAREAFDNYAGEVSANALNRYGHLELSLRDDPKARKTKSGDNSTPFTQESTPSTTRDYYEVPLAGSGWQSGCKRF